MIIHPDDRRYFGIWIVLYVLAFLVARAYLVNPILAALQGIR